MKNNKPELDLNLYELMDRSCMLHNSFLESIEDHEGLDTRPELEEMSRDVSKMLFDFYQACTAHWYRENKHLYKRPSGKKPVDK